MKKKLFHGDFKITTGKETRVVKADFFAYNYLHYRFLVWRLYGKAEMIFFARVPESLAVIMANA